MRGLEHIAAGIKYEVRRFGGLRYGRRFLTESLQHLVIELQTREHRHIAAEIAVSFHTLSASLRQRVGGLGDAETCHGKQEAWIDTVVARLDAFPAEHAGRRPFARRVGTLT